MTIKNNDKNWHEIISEKVRKNRKSFRLNFARKIEKNLDDFGISTLKFENWSAKMATVLSPASIKSA